MIWGWSCACYELHRTGHHGVENQGQSVGRRSIRLRRPKHLGSFQTPLILLVGGQNAA